MCAMRLGKLDMAPTLSISPYLSVATGPRLFQSECVTGQQGITHKAAAGCMSSRPTDVSTDSSNSSSSSDSHTHWQQHLQS